MGEPGVKEAASEVDATRPKRNRRLTYFRRRHLVPYLLVLPAVLVVAVVLVYPMGSATMRSFYTWPFGMPGAAEFVGWDNYTTLFGSGRFRASLIFTLVFTAVGIVFEFIVAFAGALVLDRVRRGRGLITSIAVAPYMVAPIAVGLIWRLMLQRDIGLFNYLLGFLGVERIAWLSDTMPAIAAAILAETWKSLPFVMLILLAGLTAIPDDVVEAARVDGANDAKLFRHITLPLLAPYIAIALIFETIFKLRVFDLIVTLTRGGPGGDTTPLGLLIQRLYFRYFSGGEAAGVSVILLVLGASVAALYLRFIYREIRY